MRALAASAERICWPEYLGCVFTFSHHPDLRAYQRHGRLRCIDCGIAFSRARTLRWRLLEGALLTVVVAAIVAPVVVAAALLR